MERIVLAMDPILRRRAAGGVSFIRIGGGESFGRPEDLVDSIEFCVFLTVFSSVKGCQVVLRLEKALSLLIY